MKGHECYHCKQWVAEGAEHDCWTTTERALTKDLPEDLQEAWERLRETAVDFGEQRIYASHNSIMFSRKACHFFVRPGRNRLEVVLFLGRRLRAREIKKSDKSSKVKYHHVVHIVHRDQVEAPLTDWLREAYELQDVLESAKAGSSRAGRKRAPTPKPRRAGKTTATRRKAKPKKP